MHIAPDENASYVGVFQGRLHVNLSAQLEHAVVQLVVLPLLFQKFLMISFFDDLSMIQYDDHIRIPHSAEPVGNDEDSAALHELIHSPLY